MKFLIIGGDAAGMSAASKAKRNKPELEVTVLEKTEDVSYSACGMPYNIADASRGIEDLVVRQAAVFREKQGINLLTGHDVMSIDRALKTVSGKKTDGQAFQLPYDKLLIATGASPIVPDLEGFDLPGVMVLKSLDDGRRIKAFLNENAVKKAVIIGAGYIGLEMCEALRARSISVDIVKPGPVFLPWLDKDMSKAVMEVLAANQVKLNLGHKIEKITKDGKQLKIVCNDIELQADMVLIAIGVSPNSGLAAQSGIELGASKAIAVDNTLKTSDEHIYAAGDCADAYHVVTGKKTYIPLALRANRAGWAVADTVCGSPVSLDGVAGTAVFKVFDLEVARTGLTREDAEKAGFDPMGVTIQSRSRAHSHPGSSTIWVYMVGDRKSGRLLGVQMVGKEGVAHRINAAAVALHTQMTVERFSQTDLAYAPPFGPVWDPLLTAAIQLIKKL